MVRSSSTSSSEKDWGQGRSWLIVGLSILGLGLIGAEVYAWAAEWYWGRPSYVHRPLTRVVSRQSPVDFTGIQPETRLWIDHRGLRSSPRATLRPPDLLALGNSTTFCARLDQRDTFPEQVARVLRRNLEREVVVSSGAASGLLTWHAVEQAKVLLERHRSLRGVIVMPGVSDLNRWLRGEPSEVTTDMRRHVFWGGVWQDGPHSRDLPLRGAGRLLDVVRHEGAVLLKSLGLRSGKESIDELGGRERLRKYRRSRPLIPLPQERLETLPEALSFYRRCLEELCEVCLSRDVELVLVTQPLLYSEEMTPKARSLWWSGNLGPKGADVRYLTEESYAWCLDQFNRVTLEVAELFGVPRVDLAARMTDGRGEFFHDTIHFNERGARQAGDLVGMVVADSLSLDPDPPGLVAESLYYPSRNDPALDRLHARVYYRRSWGSDPRPILVCLHPFLGDAESVSSVARGSRADGFFVVAPDLRGRGESPGDADFGGLEIDDVLDAVTAVERRYPEYVDSRRVVLEGFSGGGGTVLSALVKAPERWAMGLSWFGISDYGYDLEQGWLQTSAGEKRRAILIDTLGDPRTEAGSRAFAARASVLGAGNNGSAEIHLFVERDEEICPVPQSERFCRAAREAGLENLTLHVGTEGDWSHRLPSWGRLFATHRRAGLGRSGKSLSIPAALCPRVGKRVGEESKRRDYVVLGSCETRSFRCRLGSGEDGVGRLAVRRIGSEASAGGVEFGLSFETEEAPVLLEVFFDSGVRECGVEVGGRPGKVFPVVEGVVRIPDLYGDCEVRVWPIEEFPRGS